MMNEERCAAGHGSEPPRGAARDAARRENADRRAAPAAADPRVGPTDSADPEIDRLRAEVAAVDRRLVDLIGARVGLARRIGAAKSEHGALIVDPAREAAVVRRAAEAARRADAPADDVREIFWRLVALCRRVQLEEASRPLAAEDPR